MLRSVAQLVEHWSLACYNDWMPYSDPVKQKAFLKEYHVSYHQKRYANRISEMMIYLGSECVKCGTKESLEFDHIDPKTKEFSITRKWTRSWDILQPELDKCQLLCKECHLEKTKLQRKLQRGSPPP